MAAAPVDIWQGRYSGLPGNAEAAAAMIPKRDAQFGADLREPEEGIATVSAHIAAVPPRSRRGRQCTTAPYSAAAPPVLPPAGSRHPGDDFYAATPLPETTSNIAGA